MKSPSTTTVSDYSRILIRSWWVIVAAVVAAGATGWFAHTLQPPHYESKSTIVITVPGPATVTASYATDLSGRLNAESFRNLVSSAQVLQRVIVDDKANEIGGDRTVADLRERISAVAVPESAVVTFTAQGDSARAAIVLATLVSRETKEIVDELTFTDDGGSQTDIKIIDSATQATKVPKTSVAKSIGLGAGIGLALAVIALIGYDLVRNRVVDGFDALHSLRDARGGTA